MERPNSFSLGFDRSSAVETKIFRAEKQQYNYKSPSFCRNLGVIINYVNLFKTIAVTYSSMKN